MVALSDRILLQLFHLSGYRSRWVATSVGEVHVLEGRGTGALPPLVLLHGFSSAGVHYLPILPGLRAQVKTVVLPDLPGHGFSAWPRGGVRSETLLAGLVEALDAVLEEPAVLFGNSMGGTGAIRYALARPSLVRGLILCSPIGAAMDAGEIAEFLTRLQVETHAEALAFIDRVVHEPRLVRQALAWGVHRKFEDPRMRELLASLTPEDFLTPEQLGALRVPVLLIWGRSDRLLPAGQLEYFRKHLPPGRLRVEAPEGFGHSPYLDEPRRLLREILRFLEELG